jgi:hypothetical protein
MTPYICYDSNISQYLSPHFYRYHFYRYHSRQHKITDQMISTRIIALIVCLVGVTIATPHKSMGVVEDSSARVVNHADMHQSTLITTATWVLSILRRCMTALLTSSWKQRMNRSAYPSTPTTMAHAVSCLLISSQDSFSRLTWPEISSVQICKVTHCTFYAGDNCDESDPLNYFVDILGHGDIAEFETPGGNQFKNVMCGPGRFELSTARVTILVSKANFSVVPVSSLIASMRNILTLFTCTAHQGRGHQDADRGQTHDQTHDRALEAVLVKLFAKVRPFSSRD